MLLYIELFKLAFQLSNQLSKLFFLTWWTVYVNLIKESGRVGRDGNEAYCILFYRLNDLFRQSTMVCTEKTGVRNLYSVLYYCTQV